MKYHYHEEGHFSFLADEDFDYQIRYLDKSTGYYCILWYKNGESLFVNTVDMFQKYHRSVYDEVQKFEKGESQFKTIKELLEWALISPYA